MRVEINDGKIVGWLTTQEAMKILKLSNSQLVKHANAGRFSEKDHMVLYGRHFFRKSAIDKIAKKTN